MSLVIADCLTICDYLHEWIEEMQDVCGSKGAWKDAPRDSWEMNTIMEGLFELKAYASDPGTHSMTDANAAAMCRHLDREKGRWSYYTLARMAVREILLAVDMHLRNYGDSGLNAFLRANSKRVGYWLRCARDADDSLPVFPIDPENCFPPGYYSVTDNGYEHGATWNEATPPNVGMSQFDTTGPGAGTYTAGEDIDTDNFGKANLLLQCSFGDNTTNSTFDITCKLIDGSTEIKTVGPVMNLTNAVYDIAIHDTNMYIGVTLMALQGGTGKNGDIWNVLSELERFTKIR